MRRCTASGATVVDKLAVVAARLGLLDETTGIITLDDGGPAADTDALLTSGMADAAGPPTAIDWILAVTVPVMAGEALAEELRLPQAGSGARPMDAKGVGGAIDDTVDVTAGCTMLAAALVGCDGEACPDTA